MPTLYADADDLMDRLAIPAGDTRENTLIQAVGAATRWVEDQLGGRHFYTTSQTRYYTPRWHYPGTGYGYGVGMYPWGSPERPSGGGYADIRIVIDDVLSVTSVATDQDGDGVYETLWTVGQDYWVGPRNAPSEGKPYKTINRNQATGRLIFPAWEESVAVTGAFGYSTTVPELIRELTLYVAELLSRNVLEMSIPGIDTYKLGTDLQVTMSSTDLPMVYQKILEQYRDSPLGV